MKELWARFKHFWRNKGKSEFDRQVIQTLLEGILTYKTQRGYYPTFRTAHSRSLDKKFVVFRGHTLEEFNKVAHDELLWLLRKGVLDLDERDGVFIRDEAAAARYMLDEHAE